MKRPDGQKAKIADTFRCFWCLLYEMYHEMLQNFNEEMSKKKKTETEKNYKRNWLQLGCT